MEKTSSVKSWIFLGGSFIVILFVFAGLISMDILYLNDGARSLISAIFGAGGAAFLLIGITKYVIQKFRK